MSAPTTHKNVPQHIARAMFTFACNVPGVEVSTGVTPDGLSLVATAHIHGKVIARKIITNNEVEYHVPTNE
jgi:hypothetical protein